MKNDEQYYKLCIIIPTYNNAKTVVYVINQVMNYCEKVIVVNDGSNDNTGELLKQCQELTSVVTLPKNKGKGKALVMGFREAMRLGFTHAITIDADGQHFADDIDKFKKFLINGFNGIVVGARNLKENNMPGKSTFANKFSNFWFRLQTGINLPDTQTGFRLYTLSSIRGLRWITSRYEAELELLVFAAWAGVDLKSVPVKVYYPPVEERVTHFRPAYDFTRISILNTFLCIGAIFYGYPRLLFRKIKRVFK